MPYDYLCKDCGHEFDYCDGAAFVGGGEIIICPVCKNHNIEE